MSVAAARVAAAILAGGRATRMSAGVGGDAGIVKGLLAVEGQRIIDRQLAVLHPRFTEVLISANDPEPWADLGLRVIPDRSPPVPSPRPAGGALGRGAGLGPLAGLDAVLATLPPTIDAVVCVAGDMPFLSAALLERLRDGVPGAPALVPRVGGRPEPLLARYGRGAAPIVREQLARGAHAMVDLLARLSVTWIDEPELRSLDPDLRSIVNINTLEDLARLERRES
jgi:molybdopterin-guanine dinucleotide biosynthesis protein A